MAPALESSGKKLGPNDKCSCGSGKKFKKCCFAAAPAHTPIQSPPGQLLPGSVEELWNTGKDASRAGEDQRAVHMYTMAIDKLAKGMARDKDGVAADADLLALNRSSDGKLAGLLADRSKAYLRQGDTAAAAEDADTSTRADPSSEEGHLRLVVAHAAAGAPLQVQLEACERGIEECPASEVLVNRKWKLKKAIAELPPVPQGEAAPAGPQAQEPTCGPCIENTRRLADDALDPRRAMAAGDLGAALAVGAHGLAKDLVAAERYLRIGSEGGCVVAQRHLAVVLLELGRQVEAAEELRGAAEAGDEEAAGVLGQLAEEASAQERAARAKLEAMAAGGDPRAVAMLEELAMVGA